MFEQFNAKQFVTFSKQFSDTAFKAHNLAIAGFERAVDLQLKAIEGRVNAAVDFWGDAAEVRDAETARTLFPKSVSLAKDSAEKLYQAQQELMGLTIKTSEAIGDLFKTSFESANEAVTKTVEASTKKAAK